MLRHTLAVLALATVAGCSANSSFTPFASNDAEHAQLAAYAASTKYPGDMKPSSDMNIGAITNPSDGKIKLVNFTDQPIRDARVWVNGVYVHKVDLVPAHGSVTIKNDQLFDTSGVDMATAKSFPTKIEVESHGKLYNAPPASME